MRDNFEESLPDQMEAALETGREQREELLAEHLETQMRQEFEEGLDEAIEIACPRRAPNGGVWRCSLSFHQP
jgi:hypothetical protein